MEQQEGEAELGAFGEQKGTEEPRVPWLWQMKRRNYPDKQSLALLHINSTRGQPTCWGESSADGAIFKAVSSCESEISALSIAGSAAVHVGQLSETSQ